MSLAPIWSMKPIGNVELADVPLSLLNPATQAVWGDNELTGLDSQYYFGKGLIDKTRPNGLLYHAEKGEASVEWLADLLSSKSIFAIGSLVFLSQQVADTLQGFDFGVGRLAKIDVFRQDAKTTLDIPFYLLEFPNKKDTIDREKTDRCRPLYKSRPEAGYKLPGELKGRDVIVHSSAVAGPDFWFDPMILHYQFVHDDVAKSLIAMGLQDAFKLNQCKYSDA